MLDIIRRGSQSWAVKIIFGIIILVFVFWGVGSMGTGLSGSVAEVNGESISMADYLKVVQANIDPVRRNVPEFASSPALQEQFKRDMLRDLILSRLRLQEAARLGLVVTPHELRDAIGAVSLFQDESGTFDPQQYLSQLKAMRVTAGEFEAEQRDRLLEAKLMQYVAGGVSVSDREVRDYVEHMMETRTVQYLLFPIEDYLNEVNITDEQVAAYYAENMSAFALPARMNVAYLSLTPATLAGSYRVDDAEARAYYQENAGTFVEPAAYQSRQIFLQAPAEGADDDIALATLAEVQEKMAGLRAQILDGADFAALAREHSQEPASAPLGGEMGWLTVGQLPESIDAAALALDKGQLSDVVRSQYGLHLILLEDKRPERTVPFEEAAPAIRDLLAREKARTGLAAAQARAEEWLRQGSDLAELAGELGVPLEETGLIPQSDVQQRLALHQDAMGVLQNVPVGRPAPAPLEVTDGVALVMVREARPAEVPALEEVAGEIRDRMSRDRATTLAAAVADKVLAEIRDGGGESMDARLQKSQAVNRVLPYVQPFGLQPELTRDLFLAAPGSWLPASYATDAGVLIGRTGDISTLNETEFEGLRPQYARTLLQGKQQMVMESFLQNLAERATFKENGQLLDQLRLQ